MGHRGIGRRLAAIMFTDLVGYSASIQKNEPLALRKLDIHRRMVRSLLPKFKGREIETAGDSFLIEFDSSLAAVRYAVALQKRHAAYNKDMAPEQQILVRIGVHLRDIEHERKGVLGDGVNIAARIEPLSPQGGLSITEHIHSHVRNHFEVTFLALGPQILKNIIEPIPVLVLDAAAIASIPEQSPARPKLAAAPRRPPWIVTAAAIVLTALAASGLLLYRQQAQTLPRSIAVLPFDNFGDPQNQYFTDGLQDSLITGLAHIHGLRVIARSSVMQFRKSDRDMRAIGRQLGVARLVEGSVQKEGDHLRINIQMIDPETDSHVWAELYDRSVTDIFTVGSQVSEQVAEALKLELSGAEKKNVEQHSTTNLAAYTAYLQGNCYYNRLAEGDLDKAIGFYQESLRLDPDNAQSLAALSSALSSLGDHSTPAEAAQIYQRALAAARQALAIAPGLAQAHVALGWLLLNVDWNISGAELEFHAAESLNP
jgi:TolB-like protein/class 3 adenylate cyclase